MHILRKKSFLGKANCPGRHLWNCAVPSQNLPPCTTRYGNRTPDDPLQLRANAVIETDAKLDLDCNEPAATRTSTIRTNISPEIKHDTLVSADQMMMPVDKGINNPLFHKYFFLIPILISEIQEDFIPQTISIWDVIKSEEMLNTWTGIPTIALLEAIVGTVAENVLGEVSTQSITDEIKVNILIVFVKMKTNMNFEHMSPIFNLDATTLWRKFKTIVPIIRTAIQTGIYFPRREEIRRTLPLSFKPDFINVRAVLDCIEIPIEIPKCANCKNATYSHDKGSNTLKFLVCVTPAGHISFVSPAYNGKSSERFMFNSENLIDKFETDDAIMVDKGFSNLNELNEKGIILVRPSTFSKGFDESKVIERIKIFAMLKNRIEHSMISHISDILFIASAITNLSAPIIVTAKF